MLMMVQMKLHPIQHQFISGTFCFMLYWSVDLAAQILTKILGKQESSCTIIALYDIATYIKEISIFDALKYNKPAQFGTKRKKKLMLRLMTIKHLMVWLRYEKS